jgi:hypothetical protein
VCQVFPGRLLKIVFARIIILETKKLFCNLMVHGASLLNKQARIYPHAIEVSPLISCTCLFITCWDARVIPICIAKP